MRLIRPHEAVLMPGRVVAVQPSLVRALGGMHEAAVVQQLQYHAFTECPDGGDCWAVLTGQQWSTELGLTVDQVDRTIKRLVKMGVVESQQPGLFDRTRWLRIDYDRLDELVTGSDAETPARAHSADLRNGSRESAGSDSVNLRNVPSSRRRRSTARATTTSEPSEPAEAGASKTSDLADTERVWDGSRFVAIRDGVVVPLPQRGPDLAAVIGTACGYDAAHMTGRARREISEASRELRDLGADEADVRRVAKVMRQQWGEGALTPPSLVRHWPRFVAQRDPEAGFAQQPHRVVPGVRFVDGRLVEDPTVTGEVEP